MIVSLQILRTSDLSQVSDSDEVQGFLVNPPVSRFTDLFRRLEEIMNRLETFLRFCMFFSVLRVFSKRIKYVFKDLCGPRSASLQK